MNTSVRMKDWVKLLFLYKWCIDSSFVLNRHGLALCDQGDATYLCFSSSLYFVDHFIKTSKIYWLFWYNYDLFILILWRTDDDLQTPTP